MRRTQWLTLALALVGLLCFSLAGCSDNTITHSQMAGEGDGQTNDNLLDYVDNGQLDNGDDILATDDDEDEVDVNGGNVDYKDNNGDTGGTKPGDDGPGNGGI